MEEKNILDFNEIVHIRAEVLKAFSMLEDAKKNIEDIKFNNNFKWLRRPDMAYYVPYKWYIKSILESLDQIMIRVAKNDL